MERRLDLLGVCKARMVEQGMKVIHGSYQGRNYGVTLMMTQEQANRIEKVNHVNERIISVMLKFHTRKTTFIEVYAPHQGRVQEEKKDFYQMLQNTIDVVVVEIK